MKYAEFTALCQREWMQQDRRGDVCGLTLTDESLHELAVDVHTGSCAGQMVLRIKEEDLPEVSAGASLSHLSNPVTRTAVKVEGGASVDLYQVSHAVPYMVLAP